MSGDVGGVELAVRPKERYRDTTHDLAPSPVGKITPLTPEKVAEAFGGKPDLEQVLHMLGEKIMPFPRPAGPDTAWNVARQTIVDLLGRVPGQRILGGKPVELNPLAGLMPDKTPDIASLPDSLRMVPRPPLKEISPPPYDPRVVTRLVPPPGLEILDNNGGPSVGLAIEAIRFHGEKDPKGVGQKEPTADEWARVNQLLTGELNDQQVPGDLDSPRGRAGRHLALRFLQVEQAIVDDFGGREGLRNSLQRDFKGDLTPRAGEAMSLLLLEMRLKNSLVGLARGDSSGAFAELAKEREAAEVCRDDASHPNLKAAGLEPLQEWAKDRVTALEQLIGIL